MIDIARRDYLPRFVDSTLAEKLSYMGAVVIRGPKWCGKTETALQQAASAVMLQDPDHRENNLMLATTKPSILLRGDRPRLIDEWQDAPQLWDAVRYAVDRDTTPGQFMLTGSATPASRPAHSGTGRFAFIDMLPMSLSESRESTREVHLTDLFNGQDDAEGCSNYDVESMASLVCRGGWPRAVLARDTVSRDTVDSYIATLRSLYVVQDLPAWTPSLHSKVRIAKSPTRHFADPSIACAALGASPELLLRDMSTYGLLFESLCVRDLRVYAEACGGSVFHYRDDSSLEADAVVQLENGRYALFEVKMSARLLDEGAANLLRMAQKIDTSIMGSPAFLAILTPGGYAYRRADGVFVIPIGCLTA